MAGVREIDKAYLTSDGSLFVDREAAEDHEYERPARRPWSVLVYVAGDNDLSEEGVADVQEMSEILNSDRLHIAAEIDTAGTLGSVRYEIPRRVWSNRGTRTVVRRLPEQNSGDPDTLRRFVTWGAGRCRAANRLVIVGGHGSGRSIAPDYSDSGDSLDLLETRRALETAVREAGAGIAILGFDACLMSMIESANHLHGLVDHLVASQELIPKEGWPYRAVLEAANEDPAPAALTRRIVDAYIDAYEQAGQPFVTLAAIDVARTEAAVAALNRLGTLLAKALRGGSGGCRPAMRMVRKFARAFFLIDYVDLVDAANLTGEEIARRDDIPDADKAVIGSAVEDLVTHVRAAVYPGRPRARMANVNGLSVWFPEQRNLYLEHRDAYLALRCNNQGSGWVDFLDAYHAI